MKYCSYCGRPLEDGSVCECNQKQDKTSGKTSQIDMGKIKKLAIPVAFLLVILIALICVISYVRTGINLEDYMVIEGVTGLNGQGTLSYSLDTAALNKALVGEEDYSGMDEDNYEEMLAAAWETFELADKAMRGISLTASQETGLSNGDVVTITATFENSDNEKFPYHFKNGSINYTVSGLADGIVVDPFAEECVTLNFTGINTYGECSVEVLSQETPYSIFTYQLSKTEQLSNGDSVILSVQVDQTALTELGYYMPEVMEKEFIVSELPEGKSVDPFAEEAISVQFTGISTRGTATVEIITTEEVISLFGYKLSKEKDLSNGDVITVTAQVNPGELIKLGYLIPDTLEKQFTVEKLGTYFDPTDGFPQDKLSEICSNVRSLAKEEDKKSYFPISSPSEINGAYFLKAIDPAVPYEDLWNGYVFDNLLAVITKHTEERGLGLGEKEVQTIWVLPNFFVDTEGNLSYRAEDILSYSDKGTDWLKEEYSQMKISELNIPSK